MEIKKSIFTMLIGLTIVCASISCGSDTATNPTVGEDASNSGLDIKEWLSTVGWKKYTTTIELNGEAVTYTIVFPYGGSCIGEEINIFDNYDGSQNFGYTWGYKSGHKIMFKISDMFVRFWNNDTIIINQYNAMTRLEKNGPSANNYGDYKEKLYVHRSYYWDKDEGNVTERYRDEDLYDVALPKYLKLTSEGLLMTYYTYNSKTGAIVNDNLTALFKF